MRYALAALALLALAQPSAAKVVKFEVVRIELPAFEGRSFGAVGTYDRIIARATIAVAPDDPHNAVIVDLDRAPRNAQGLVEAVSDVEILRPTIAANGNRRLFYDVLNRGNKPALGDFNDIRSGNDLVKAGDAGTGFLMNRGYTLVWSGWQGDVPAGGGRLTFSPPVVAGVTGPSREEFIFDHSQNPATAKLTYPAADLDPAHATLTVREREADPRAKPADLSFKFDGPSKILINRPAGFDFRRDLRIHLYRHGPQGDGAWFCRDTRHRHVPAASGARRVACTEYACRHDRPRHRLGPLAERPLPARFPLSRLQR